jgi:hypothetical protein
MAKTLIVEYGDGKEPTELPWDDGSKQRFKLDEDEVEQLEAGKLVWRGPTAFELVGE